MDEPAIDFGTGGQLGDVTSRDVAGGNLTNISVSSEQAIRLLADDIRTIIARLEQLERLEAQHANERGAMTRLITMLATESHTVSDVQHLLERQIASEAAERDQRRRYLDAMLTSLVVLAVINVLFHIYNRVLRRSGDNHRIAETRR